MAAHHAHDTSEKNLSNASGDMTISPVQEEDILDIKYSDIPSFIFFIALMIIVFLQFFTRYVLNDSLGWTEEIARYLLILVAFSGAIIGTRKGTHIFLEFCHRFIPSSISRIISKCVEVLNIIFYAYMAYIGYKLAIGTHQNLVSISIPKSLIYSTVSACFVSMLVYSIWWLFNKNNKIG